MRIITPDLIKGKKVLLRLDIDVPLAKWKVDPPAGGGEWRVGEDFKLAAGLPTVEMCLHNAKSVIVLGHIGRPGGKVVPALSVKPIVEWFEENLDCQWDEGKFQVLENLRFEEGEEKCDLGFAKKLSKLGDIYINEAFAAHHPSASTTILPTLMPHAIGLRFFQEVEVLTGILKTPKRPLVAIIGGAKVEGKLEGKYKAVAALSHFCDYVLVGGLLAREIKEKKLETGKTVIIGKLSPSGLDMSEETINNWVGILKNAKFIIWGGPVGKYEVSGGNIGNEKLAEAILASSAESIIGGGDTTAALGRLGLLQKLGAKGFISTGGGAMLKLLSEGTLPTINTLI